MTSAGATGGVRRRWAAAIVAVLLLVAAGLLVVGVALERHTESGAEHSTVVPTGEQQERHHDESTEAAHAESGLPPNEGRETAERLTGISFESPWIVALGSVASIACALAIWLRPSRPVITIVVAFTAAALILDVLEISHQIGAGRNWLAALAGVIAAVRVAVIVGGGYLYRTATVST